MNPFIKLESEYGAQNYSPLPVVLVRGEGVYVWDDAGNRYIDMMSAYSAVSHGHCHPRLVKALVEQAETLAIISRAFYSNKLAAFLQKICQLTKLDKALPMNTGAEAVETALKAARKWAYTVKKVPADKAEIIVCEGNFHGRTIAIVGMSSELQYRDGFGPFPAGTVTIPFGDADALAAAITPNTAAFLVEPIQGENGVIIPPAGYLKKCADLCKKNNVLMICDEIQTGLGRTGKFLTSEYEDFIPDGVVLGKALGGGLLPVSLFLARKEVMDVFTPGDHGSTFGGNPLAAVVGAVALDVLVEDKLVERSAELGAYFLQRLQAIQSPLIVEARGKGLLVGLEINPRYYSARDLCIKLLKYGILTKETQSTVLRLAPPLLITREQLDTVISALASALAEVEKEMNGAVDQT
jgi:ornithine--oxo-acid transaminase